MSKQANSQDTPNVISLLESECGQQLLDSQESPTLDLFGLEVVPVKSTALLAKEKAQVVTKTYGRYLPASSQSAALQRSMENRLRRLLDTDGLTEYEQTLKRKITPSGVSYLEHTARGRRTSGSDCGGWGSLRCQTVRTTKQRDDHHGNLEEMVFLVQDQLAGWATPRAGKTTNEDPEAWQKRKDKGDVSTMPLTLQAQMAGWPTCSANEDAAGTAKGKMQQMLSHAALTCGSEANGTTAATESNDVSRLNPGFSLWLMLGTQKATEWLRCAELAMRST